MVRQSKLGRSLDADRERTAVSLQRNVSLSNDDLCLGVRRNRQQTRCYRSGSCCVSPQSFLKGFGLGAPCLCVLHLSPPPPFAVAWRFYHGNRTRPKTSTRERMHRHWNQR